MTAAPFPWFGGKSRAAHLIWARIGNVPNYVEPFFGSGAVLLGRPTPPGIETVNDLDGFVCNFWRAVAADPATVARHADWPVNENDLHARHINLVGERADLVARLEGNPAFYDARIAGWWVWGLCAWIGGGWCSGKGSWTTDGERITRKDDGLGVVRQLPHLGDGGRGVHRPSLEVGVNRQLPCPVSMGVHRPVSVETWLTELAARLRRVRVCCGDWQRITGPAFLYMNATCGIVLDPPYADTAGRYPDLYAQDSLTVAHDVREWAIANGEDPRLRIALCGFDGEHVMPDNWEEVPLVAQGGYGSANSDRERIWFSPHCLRPDQELTLF